MSTDFILNDAQKKAVEDTEGAVLVIAGAGSGKTRVLTARVCHLVDKGVDPYNILAITFTNKAANEMKERIECNLGASAKVWTSTFHSMCAKILRFDADKLGYSSDFSIYTDLESERVVKRVCAQIPGADPKKKDDYLNHISTAKTAGLSPEEYLGLIAPDCTDAHTVFAVYKAYENELKLSNALDFDDLLLKTVQLLRDFPEVAEKYQNRFLYINVDEFQDTNGLQYELVKILSAKHGNIFVVGDEDQSIYSWRGAQIKNVLDFPKDFKGAKVYKLEQNYRSTISILDAANNVISHNCARNAKTLWSDIKGSDSIRYYEANSDRDEAAYVSREITRQIYGGKSCRDFAVLVRVNSLTRLFEEDFNLYGIPYRVFGGFKFFERKEIKDALAYVRLALNSSDNDSLLRVVNYPTRGIGKSAVEELISVAAKTGTTLFSVMINPGYLTAPTAKKLGVFRDIAEDIITQASILNPVEFMQFVIRRSGLEDSLKSSGDAEDINRLENIGELVGAVQGFISDNPDATISDFMQSVALVSDSDSMDNDDYVTIATVHAVKGLEFDTVFVVGLEEGIFPVNRSIAAGDVEEERRLMYVAITRARTALYVTNARSRFRFGEVAVFPKSRFVTEMQGGVGSIRITAPSPQSERALGGYNRDGQSRYGQRSNSGEFVATASKPFDKRNIEGNTQKIEKGKKDYSQYHKDAIVEHNKFGRGIIISTTGEGDEKTAAIAFKGLGVKRFALYVAAPNLKIVE